MFRLWLLVFIFGCPFSCSALAQETPDTGFVEGRIVALEEAPAGERAGGPTGGRATVELRGGERVQALLPSPLPEGSGMTTPELPDYRVGDRVELYFSPGPEGARQYAVSDWVRRPALYWLVGLFLPVAVTVGRLKVARAFLATSACLVITVTFVIPGILSGSSPVPVSLVGVGGMLVPAIYFVHGVSWSTTASFVGTLVAVIITMLIGMYFSDLARSTGLGSDEALLIAAGAAQVNLGLLLSGSAERAARRADRHHHRPGERGARAVARQPRL